MNKKMITAIALCGMVAGLAQGANIRYRQSGDWSLTAPLDTGSGWQNVSVVPGLDDNARINWGGDVGNTVTVSSSQTVGAVEIGVNESGTVVVQNGGTLTTSGAGSQNGHFFVGNVAASNPQRTGTLTIDAGGLVAVNDATMSIGRSILGTVNVAGALTTSSHLWMGNSSSNGKGILNILDGGTVTVGGNIGLGSNNAVDPSGGTAFINVFSGGTLNLAQWSATGSIQDGSVLTINEGGTLIVGGNRVSQANDYFTAGKIVSDLGEIEATYDAGTLLTTIVAIPEPATLGLVAAFGGVMLFVRRRFMI